MGFSSVYDFYVKNREHFCLLNQDVGCCRKDAVPMFVPQAPTVARRSISTRKVPCTVTSTLLLILPSCDSQTQMDSSITTKEKPAVSSSKFTLVESGFRGPKQSPLFSSIQRATSRMHCANVIQRSRHLQKKETRSCMS